MNTDALIETLAQDGLNPTRGLWRWPVPLLAALALALAALGLALGRPLAALPQIGAAPYAMKLAFALSVAALGALALQAAGKPGKPLTGRLAILAVPFAAVLALATMELAALEPVWPGRTWARCAASIALLTPLGFAAAVTLLHRLAPTRLRLAGALAGIVAGGLAASGYALWCPETTAVFLLAW
jgi:hypothetical protein